MIKSLLILAACFLAVMYVEAQEIKPVIVTTPTTGEMVCFEVSPGIWDCQ